jgi:hypothetical protein
MVPCAARTVAADAYGSRLTEHAWARAAVEGRSAATSGRSGATYVCTPVRGVTVSAVAVGGRGGGVGEASTPCG